jgi:ribosomal protein L18E
MTVAAFSFSTAARKLIEASGGKTLSIGELLKSNKDAKDVIIIT